MVLSSRMSLELVSKSHRSAVALLFDHVQLMVAGRSSAMERSLLQDPRKQFEFNEKLFPPSITSDAYLRTRIESFE